MLCLRIELTNGYKTETQLVPDATKYETGGHSLASQIQKRQTIKDAKR